MIELGPLQNSEIITPLPATPLYKRLEVAGRLTRPKHWQEFIPFAMAHTPLKMTIEEAHAEVNYGWAHAYSPEALAKAVEAMEDKPLGYRINVFVVPTARSSKAAHASYMHVWTTANARATIGVPSLASRTACRAALFHWMTTFDCSGELAVAIRGKSNKAAIASQNFIKIWEKELTVAGPRQEKGRPRAWPVCLDRPASLIRHSTGSYPPRLPC